MKEKFLNLITLDSYLRELYRSINKVNLQIKVLEERLKKEEHLEIVNGIYEAIDRLEVEREVLRRRLQAHKGRGNA